MSYWTSFPPDKTAGDGPQQRRQRPPWPRGWRVGAVAVGAGAGARALAGISCAGPLAPSIIGRNKVAVAEWPVQR